MEQLNLNNRQPQAFPPRVPDNNAGPTQRLYAGRTVPLGHPSRVLRRPNPEFLQAFQNRVLDAMFRVHVQLYGEADSGISSGDESDEESVILTDNESNTESDNDNRNDSDESDNESEDGDDSDDSEDSGEEIVIEIDLDSYYSFNSDYDLIPGVEPPAPEEVDEFGINYEYLLALEKVDFNEERLQSPLINFVNNNTDYNNN